MAKRYRYQNTRQWVRLPCEWYVKYTLEGQPGPEALAMVVDAGAGGLRLRARERVPLGTRLALKISVPPLRRTLAAAGRVVRVEAEGEAAWGWGILFEQIAEPDRDALNQQLEAMGGHDRLARHRGAWWRRV